MIHLKGDATRPQGEGNKIIAHIVNTHGGWGTGFVVSISKRWKAPELRYRKWYREGSNFELGNVQFVLVEEDPKLIVANMIAQDGYRKRGSKFTNQVFICYESLRECLEKVAIEAKNKNSSIHMPLIGTGLAGGSWDVIEPIIQETMKDIQVFVYHFE